MSIVVTLTKCEVNMLIEHATTGACPSMSECPIHKGKIGDSKIQTCSQISKEFLDNLTAEYLLEVML